MELPVQCVRVDFTQLTHLIAGGTVVVIVAGIWTGVDSDGYTAIFRKSAQATCTLLGRRKPTLGYRVDPLTQGGRVLIDAGLI